MVTAPISIIRIEVLAYLKACANLLADHPGSHDEFMIASEALQQKDGHYTDQERDLVQGMVLRLSVKHGK